MSQPETAPDIPSSPPARGDATAWVPYVAPMAAFLILTSAEGYLSTKGDVTDPARYPWAYAAKVAIVAAVAWACRSTWRDFSPRPGPSGWALAIGIGLAVAVGWVGLDGLAPPIPFISGTRSGFDPGLIPMPGRYAFIAARFFGLVALVPLVEELFWRSFLVRYVIDPDFTRIPVGRVTATAAAVTSVLFALVHPEYLQAFLTGLAWAWLLWKTRSLSACLVSHATANLALGIYVLATGDRKFW